MEKLLNNSSGIERASFGSRLGALILDLVLLCLLALVVVPFATFLGLYTGAAQGASGGETLEQKAVLAYGGSMIGMLMGFFISTILAMVLYSLVEALSGASLGKMILGLKVANQDGTRADTGKYLLRWVVKYSGALLGFAAALTSIALLNYAGNIAGLVIAGGCFLVLGPARLSLQDMASKTAVYRKSDIVN